MAKPASEIARIVSEHWPYIAGQYDGGADARDALIAALEALDGSYPRTFAEGVAVLDAALRNPDIEVPAEEGALKKLLTWTQGQVPADQFAYDSATADTPAPVAEPEKPAPKTKP